MAKVRIVHRHRPTAANETPDGPKPELVERIAAGEVGDFVKWCAEANDEGVPTLQGGTRGRVSSAKGGAGYRRPPTRPRAVELPTIRQHRRARATT